MGRPQVSTKLSRKFFSFLDDIHAFGVEINHIPLQIPEGSLSDPRSVFERPEVPNVELHGDPQRIPLSVRFPYVSQTVGPEPAVINFCPGYEPRAVAIQKNTAEVFAIVIGEHARVPGTGSLR